LLEEQIGVALFRRRHRALELTDEGTQLFALAAPWLAGLGEFVRAVRTPDRPPVVAITASNGVSALWLLPRLGGFQAAHAALDVRVIASDRVLNLEAEGIDLAIRYCRQDDAPPGAELLFHEDVAPVACPAVAARAFAAGAKLLDEVLLEFDDRTRPWLRWADWLTAMDLAEATPKGRLHFNQYDQAVHAAVQGHGVALGRMALVAPMLRDGRLVAHPHGHTRVGGYAYWLVGEDERCTPATRLLADWIRREAELSAAPCGGGC
jgi:LysR family glycine cleavage system transcriptional activator